MRHKNYQSFRISQVEPLDEVVHLFFGSSKLFSVIEEGDSEDEAEDDDDGDDYSNDRRCACARAAFVCERRAI